MPSDASLGKLKIALQRGAIGVGGANLVKYARDGQVGGGDVNGECSLCKHEHMLDRMVYLGMV